MLHWSFSLTLPTITGISGQVPLSVHAARRVQHQKSQNPATAVAACSNRFSLPPFYLIVDARGAAFGNPGVIEMAGYPVSRARSHSGPGSYVLHQSRDRPAEMTGIRHGPNLVVSSLSVQMLRSRADEARKGHHDDSNIQCPSTTVEAWTR
ncbi:hypothetical protein B0T14DRAFT_180156 [Immersiella caudata]|uniref:Uncharacterized protein n=1 Tax=Immersiella caudata TaxID=314043 RepID=A0AA40C3B0_9PEZI|nr:hypothetical protein B0T14DRAFT_180156 [Immersiella caudata]